MIVVVIILAVTTIGVSGVHELTLSRSLSPGNMILNSSEIETVMYNSSRWNVAFLPSGDNIASAHYTNAFYELYEGKEGVIGLVKDPGRTLIRLYFSHFEYQATVLQQLDVLCYQLLRTPKRPCEFERVRRPNGEYAQNLSSEVIINEGQQVWCHA